MKHMKYETFSPQARADPGMQFGWGRFAFHSPFYLVPPLPFPPLPYEVTQVVTFIEREEKPTFDSLHMCL